MMNPMSIMAILNKGTQMSRGVYKNSPFCNKFGTEVAYKTNINQ